MTVLAARESRALAVMGPSLVAAVSQALALAQLALLLLGQPAGPTTDAYFLVFTWSLAPIQVVLVGVAYPRWLRAQEFGRRGGVVGLIVVAVLGLASATAAGVIFGRVGESVEVLVALTALLALNSAVLTGGWALALRRAAHGRGAWLAGVTLPSNLMGCAALLLPVADPGQRVLWMCGGLLGGSVLFSLAIWRRGGSVPAGSSVAGGPVSSTTSATDSRWFAAKSVTGYGAGLALQTMTAAIPSPSLTYVNVLARLVSGFATVVTNALLPRLVTAGSTSSAGAIRYCWVVTTCGVALGLGVASIAVARQDQWLGLAAVGLAWVVATTLNASVQRVATRFASARVAALSIGTSVLVTGAAVVGGGIHTVDMAFVLTAFVGLDLLSGVAYAVVLRELRLAAVALAGSAAILGLAVSTFAG